MESDSDLEYVQLKDMRHSGTEPDDVLSAYKFQGGCIVTRSPGMPIL